MSKDWYKNSTYGNAFQKAVTARFEAFNWTVQDTHLQTTLGYDIVITPPWSSTVTKVELKRQRELKHVFEALYNGKPSTWRGNADQMWVWSDGRKSFELYNAKLLEAYLLLPAVFRTAFLCGDYCPGTRIGMSTCVELPFDCKEAGWIHTFTPSDLSALNFNAHDPSCKHLLRYVHGIFKADAEYTK